MQRASYNLPGLRGILRVVSECCAAGTKRPASGPFPDRGSGPGDRHPELLAHHVLAGEQLLGACALLVEDDLGEPRQVVARLVDGLAVRVDPRKLLHEADVTVLV